MLVDMYHIVGAQLPGHFIDIVKKTLSQRPTKCLGVRLLMDLNDNTRYIVVSYWPDNETMLIGTASLHGQIIKLLGAETELRTENYEIKHEI
jgi:hypothetical protein